MNSHTLSRLVRQQFWLFGWDVRRSQGNILIECGFQRTPNPAGAKSGSTRYHRITDDGDMLTLWGFGACLSSPDHGSIYVPRIRTRVSWTPESSIVPEYWFTDVAELFAFPSSGREQAASDMLTLRLLDALIAYETTVLERYGSRYREDAIAAWRDPFGDPASLLQHWRTLRQQVSRQLELDAVLAVRYETAAPCGGHRSPLQAVRSQASGYSDPDAGHGRTSGSCADIQVRRYGDISLSTGSEPAPT